MCTRAFHFYPRTGPGLILMMGFLLIWPVILGSCDLPRVPAPAADMAVSDVVPWLDPRVICTDPEGDSDSDMIPNREEGCPTQS